VSVIIGDTTKKKVDRCAVAWHDECSDSSSESSIVMMTEEMFQ